MLTTESLSERLTNRQTVSISINEIYDEAKRKWNEKKTAQLTLYSF